MRRNNKNARIRFKAQAVICDLSCSQSPSVFWSAPRHGTQEQSIPRVQDFKSSGFMADACLGLHGVQRQSRPQSPRAFWSAPRHGSELWNNQFPETNILEVPVSRRKCALVYMASRDKVDVDTSLIGIQYTLEKTRKVGIWL